MDISGSHSDGGITTTAGASADLHLQQSPGSHQAARLVPMGLTADDLRCPICVDTIHDAFVTCCGHTFCYQCITTHLKNKCSCPSCGNYLTTDHIYPNFLLSKVLLSTAATHAAESSCSLADIVQQVSVMPPIILC